MKMNIIETFLENVFIVNHFFFLMVDKQLTFNRVRELLKTDHTFKFHGKFSRGRFIGALILLSVNLFVILIMIAFISTTIDSSDFHFQLPTNSLDTALTITFIFLFIFVIIMGSIAFCLILTVFRTTSKLLIISPNYLELKQKDKVVFHIKYDFIEKFEEITESLDYHTKQAGIVAKVKFQITDRENQKIEFLAKIWDVHGKLPPNSVIEHIVKYYMKKSST